MKLLFTTLVCVFALTITSCKKIAEALQTSISASPKVIEFEIPKLAANTSEVTFKEVQVKIDMDSLVKASAPGFGSRNIKSIKLRSFKLELSNADDASNFANLESVNGFLNCEGKEPLQVVAIPNNPDTKASILNVPISSEGIELKEYLAGGTFRYVLKSKVRRATAKGLNARATVVYDFTLGL